MLIRLAQSSDGKSYAEPRAFVSAFAWLLYFSPFLALAAHGLASAHGRSMGPLDLLLWQVTLWAEMGAPFILLSFGSMHGRGPLASRLVASLTRIVASLPFARRRGVVIRASGMAIEEGGRVRQVIARSDVLCVDVSALEPLERVSDHVVCVETSKGSLRLDEVASYGLARKTGEELARDLGCPLRDSVAGHERDPQELDVAIGQREVPPDPGPPPARLGDCDLRVVDRLGYLALALRPGAKEVAAALVFGILLSAAAIAISFVGRPAEGVVSLWRLVLSAGLGFGGAWSCVLALIHGTFGVRLAVRPATTTFGSRLMAVQSIPTAAIEEVQVRRGILPWQVHVIADDGALVFAADAVMTRDQAEWVAAWTRSAVSTIRRRGAAPKRVLLTAAQGGRGSGARPGRWD